jgi:hypothetical protein
MPDAKPQGRPQDLAQEVTALRQRNAELEQALQQQQAAKGPPRGTKVHYVRGEETVCRPAEILSDGFSARVAVPGGHRLHAHLAYKEHPSTVYKDKDGKEYKPEHGFETDRHWDPLGGPDTWHTPEECPNAKKPGPSA